MMKPAALIAILSILSLPALADTWLCIAEKAADVTSKEGIVLDSNGYTSEQKLLVSEKGLKNFGSELYRLNSCHLVDGRPTMCKNSGGGWAGTFIMDRYNLFLLTGISMSTDEVDSLFVMKGKCSKIG